MPRLPKSVEKQAELADQIYQQAYGTPQQPPEAPKADETPPAPPADSTPPVATDSAPPAEPAKVEQDKPADPAEDGDLNHWKQRAKVAEGRLSKEMPRMAQTIREMKDQITDLQQKLREAESKPAVPADVGVKPEEVEQYGKDFIDMVQRVARNATPGVDQNLQAQVKEVTDQQRRVARQQFFDQLNRDAPQWEKLNTDENFLAYLGGLDPYTGRPRQELFDDAYAQLDAWRIANFFNSFSESRQSEPESPKPSLADQVVPSANKAAPKPPPAKRMWTTADIARFYDELRRGVHTPEEAARIEQDIFAAQSERRLR